MMKPVIFFSHSSKDAEALARLKELFVQKTGGTIDVFLSSDGQSIPLGRNWVHKIEDALDQAKLMVVFVSPDSISSQWLYFESGYAYSKGVRVVPVGFRGIDLTAIHPPLGLLQGFNITSKDSLDNLLFLANDAFGHNHRPSFSDLEYKEIASLGETNASRTLGLLGNYIEKVETHVYCAQTLSKEAVLKTVGDILQASGLNLQRRTDWLLHVEGMAAQFEERSITFLIDPGMFHSNASLLCQIIRAVRARGVPGTEFTFRLHERVSMITDGYIISGRLHGTGVKLHQTRGFAFRDLHLVLCSPRSLEITLNSEEIVADQVRELLDILWAKQVVFFRSDQ